MLLGGGQLYRQYKGQWIPVHVTLNFFHMNGSRWSQWNFRIFALLASNCGNLSADTSAAFTQLKWLSLSSWHTQKKYIWQIYARYSASFFVTGLCQKQAKYQHWCENGILHCSARLKDLYKWSTTLLHKSNVAQVHISICWAYLFVYFYLKWANIHTGRIL